MNVLTYEQLKQQLEAMTAECARVQAFADETARDAEEMATADGGGGGYIEALNQLLTPVTDAALAAVEARGVEKFAALLSEQVETCEDLDMGDLAIMTRMHIKDALRFAVELREGRV